MIPFLLAALPLAPVAAQPNSGTGTLIAAQPSSSAAAVCPAPVQAQVLANSGVARAAGNNFNLGAVTELFPTSLASRPTGQSLNVPLTTSGLNRGKATANGDGGGNTPPPCSSAATLVASVDATTRAGGVGLAGSTAADALYDPSSSSDAQLVELLGQNKDYSLTAYHKGSGFNRRLNGWLTFDTSSTGLRGSASSDGVRLGSVTLTFTNGDGSNSQGIDYPVIHVAKLGGQLKLSQINGSAAPANAVVGLSGRNLAVADNQLSSNAASQAFGSATIKGQGIRSLTFDVYAKGNSTGASQDRFFLSLSSAKEVPLAYGYGSVQAGVGFPGSLSGTFVFPATTVGGQRNTLALNTGFNGELAAGYRGRNLRSDLSVGYSSFGNQRQTLSLYNAAGTFVGSVSTPGTGSVNLFTVMANGYYDFKIRNQDGAISRWSPYLGAGIGYGSLSSPSCGQGCTTISGGSGGGFAYQLKAGVSYRANETSRLFLEGGYLGLTGTQAGNVNYDSFGTWRVNLGWRQSF